MKKLLLLASAAVMSASAFAGVDPASYADYQGLSLTNLWLKCQRVDKAAWDAMPMASAPNYARTSCLTGENIYVALTKELNAEGGLDDNSSLVEIDLYTGEVKRVIQLTLDGERYGGLLGANQIGCDDAGHVWVAPYIATTYNAETGVAAEIRAYTVDLATGALTKVVSVGLPSDEDAAAGRLDYFACIGDITGETSGAVFMTPVSQGQDLWVYGWQREQGGDWAPHMSDGEYVSEKMSESYPADQTTWSYAPSVTIVKDEEFSGELFYVDGFTTAPSLYNTAGTMFESFASAPDLAPALGANGVGEFSIAGMDFIVYVEGQYDAPHTCQIRICRLGEGMSFEGMELAYTLPAGEDGAGGMGDVGDSGTRIHSISTKIVTDAAGKQAVYIVTHKCSNGIGVYRLAEQGFDDGHVGGVSDMVVDAANGPAEYFNLQGQRVDAANLTAGMYIVRQGGEAQKVIVK